MITPSIPVNRLSNIVWPCVLSVGATPVDITGWTFTLIEVIPAALADNVAVAITNGPLGQFTVSLPWSNEWPTGTGKKVSVRIKPSGLDAAFPALVANLT